MAKRGSENEENNYTSDAVAGRVEQILCQPCSSKNKQTVADVFCSTCDEFQCTECSIVHKTHAFLRNHKLINAGDVKSKQVPFDMKGRDQCDQHQKVLEFFCEDDNQLCCSTCAIVDHRKCQSVVEITKIAGRSTSTSSKFKVRLQEVKSKAEMLGENAKSSKEQLEQDIKGISLKLRQMREKVIKMFDDLEISVAKDAESFKTETLEQLRKKESVIERYSASATEALDTIDDVNQNGTPSQQFILEQIIEKQVNELCSNVDRECQLETVIVAFDFDKTLQLPPLQIPDYVPGKLTLKYHIPEAVQSVALKDKIVQLTKITSIDLNLTGVEVKNPFYTGLDFLSDGRLVAVDNKNKTCLIYNEKLEKVGSYHLSYYPNDVVAVSEDEVAITSGGEYKIDFLRVSKSNEVTLIRTCEVKTQYESICLKDEGLFVVGIIDDVRQVRIVSLSGEEKNFSNNFPEKKFSIGTSACTYIRNTGKVVLADRHEHTVYLFDTETNTRVVVKDYQIKEPCGVAEGPSGCILVCSNGTDSIVKISPDGRIITSYKLDMNCPYQLSVSKDKSILAVSNSTTGTKKLQLFKLTY